jgi:hypothetical protein
MLAASADMTVKMVVPTWGSGWEGYSRVAASLVKQADSGVIHKFVVVDMARHGAGNQVAVEAVAEYSANL